MWWIVLSVVAAILINNALNKNIRYNEQERSVILSRDKDSENPDSSRERLPAIVVKLDRLYTAKKVLPIAVVVAGFCGMLLSNYTSEKQYKSNLNTYKQGWNSGWESACNYLFFKYSSSGELYAGNTKYTYSGCINDNYTYSTKYDPEKAIKTSYSKSGIQDEGEDDGYSAAITHMFENTPYLCYGTDCITLEGLAEDSWEQYQREYQYDPGRLYEGY